MSEQNPSSRRQFLKGAALVGAGAVIGACAAPVASTEAGTAEQAPAMAEELYGMVVFLKGSEFFNWCYQGMVDAAARIGPHVKTELQGPAEWDASLEARAIEELTAKGATGILTTAGDAAPMVPSINAAIEAMIPVITFDSDAPASKRLTFVGTQNYAGRLRGGRSNGRMAGRQGQDRDFDLPRTRSSGQARPGLQGRLGRQGSRHCNRRDQRRGQGRCGRDPVDRRAAGRPNDYGHLRRPRQPWPRRCGGRAHYRHAGQGPDHGLRLWHACHRADRQGRDQGHCRPESRT